METLYAVELDLIAAAVGSELDLTVWVCTAWDGLPTNLQTREHDRIAWFARGDLAGLAMADSTYLPALDRVLAPSRRDQ